MSTAPKPITAASIMRESPEHGYIQHVIGTHLRLIDVCIREAVRARHAKAVYPIEQNFNVQRITNTEAQRIVYSSIIEALEKRGFSVRLVMTLQKTELHVQWESERDAAEIARQQAIVERAMRR